MQVVRARWLAVALILACCSIGPSPSLLAWNLEPQYHRGESKRLKQIFYPNVQSLPRSSDLKTIARNYLLQEGEALGLRAGEPLPRLVEARQSLLGTHFRFEQRIGQVPIDRSEIVITVLEDGRIFQVYSTLAEISTTTSSLRSASRLSLDEAYETAWQWLGVQGQLFQDPLGRLRYSPLGDSLRLIYRVELSVTLPYGVWSIDIDAESAKVLRVDDARLSHKLGTEQPLAGPAKGPSVDRKAAFRAWKKRKEASKVLRSLRQESWVSGTAQVFNPDPRSTLKLRTLEDDSPATSFFPAYKEEALPEVSFDGQSHHLRGPWVQIVDFDPPWTPPSTSSDGSWIYQRGSSGFTDAMTYFHIDQNQRYLQKLGFKDARGIQNRPIEIDADGVNGEDASYYDRSSRRLSFGHGCVDDNEDADVILHEYAHALHMDINPSGVGGDMGAIGEGFGDYWAASYSLSTADGSAFFPEEVFTWDSRGNCNKSWQGRRLDAVLARYDFSRDYEAHTYVPGGFQSDELWSTPLFQSLLALRLQGIPHEEVDTIIIQAQFGLGSGLKMRDLAQAIVATSLALYPNGPHAAVFAENFVRQGILLVPRPKLKMTLLSSLDSGGNGALDPSEERTLRVRVSNEGDLAAKDVNLSLSSPDPAVTPLLGEHDLLSLEPGQSEEIEMSYKVAAEALCGTVLNASIDLSYGTGTEPVQKLDIGARLGTPMGFRSEAQLGIAIPDASPLGLSSVIRVENGGTVSDQLRIGLQVLHSYRGDLKVILKSPSGKQVVLHDHGGFSLDDLRGEYPLTLESKESLSTLIGEGLLGEWTLWVQDDSLGDSGTLLSWSISDTNSYSCQ